MPRKLLKFLILFDNPDLLYFPGQFISGRVLVELEHDTLIDGVFFHVLGEGTVKVKDKKHKRQVEKENYIDFKMRLLGEPDHPPVQLSAGIHSFPFKLGLPLGLPSTFLGRFGWVQYLCKAALREDAGLVHKNHQVFIVMSPIDLNVEPETLSQPFECEIEHRIGSGCTSSSGPVFCQVRLDRGGFIPGETIGIHALIDNHSSVAIKKTIASLTETIEYRSGSGTVTTERRVLTSLTRGRVAAGQSVEWVNEQLSVPAMPPTNLRGCHLIQIQYDVEFTLKPGGFEKEVRLQLPILIATYPYRHSDGTLRRKRGADYPSSLPVTRPWLDVKYKAALV